MQEIIVILYACLSCMLYLVGLVLVLFAEDIIHSQWSAMLHKSISTRTDTL